MNERHTIPPAPMPVRGGSLAEIRVGLTEQAMEQVRLVVREELDAARLIKDDATRVVLGICQAVLEQAPVEAECDADWRRRRDHALIEIEALLGQEGEQRA